MKLRNFIIVLLAVLMVFAVVSCKHEPEAKKQEQKEDTEPFVQSDSLIYKLTATKGRNVGWWSADKFVLSFSDAAEKVNQGDVLTLKYRSSREITLFNIRGTNKWIYEQPSSKYALPEGFKSEPDADGWITVTFTFGDKWYDGTAIADGTYPASWRIDFIGEIVTTDVLEVKDIKLTKSDSTVVPLTLSKEKVSNKDAYGNILPTYEETDNAYWQESADWVVFYFEGEPGESDDKPEFERVFDGMTITRDWAKGYTAKEHYSYKLLTGYTTDSPEFDPKTPIKANTRLFVIEVGDPQKVTFVTPEGVTPVEAQTIEYGKLATKPAEDPVKEGTDLFAGWYDAANKLFDFDTPITADTVLTARWGAPTVVTFDTQVEGITVEPETIPAGTTVPVPTAPKRDGYKFDGWYTASTCADAEKFDFTTTISEAKTLYAKWTLAKIVTFNENYGETPATDSVYVDPGAKVEEPAKIPMRAGYVFAGWYKEAGCTNAYNFDDAVNENITLYAKWTYGKMYAVTSTKFTEGYNHDKFVLGFTGDAEKVKAGDVVSISYRTTEPFTWFSIRKNDPETYSKWFHEKSAVTAGKPELFFTTMTTDGDWTTVTYKFPEPTANTQAANIPYEEGGSGFFIYLGNSKMVPGALMEVRAVTINGKEITLTSANINHALTQCAPTFEADVAAYDWTAQTVTFNTDGGSAVANASVDFGGRVTRPAEDPTKEGFLFDDWYADAEFSTKFDFANTPVTKAVSTIYARFAAPIAVTFDSQGGSDVAAASVPAGTPVAKPADPTKDGKFFAGWYTESAGTNAYDFKANVTEAITLYAKWADPVNLTYSLNYEGAADPTVVEVGNGLALTAPKNPARVGYFFGGWYKEAACTNAFDFAAGITEATTIYAKWDAPTVAYKFTATRSYDRFQYRWHEDKVDMFAKDYYSENDVITLMVKLESSETTLHTVYLKIRSPETTIKKVYLDQADSSASGPDANGWYSITAVVPSGLAAGGKGLYLQVYGNADWAANDILLIKAFAYNGVEIPIITGDYTDSGAMRSSGAYEGCKPNTVSVTP